VTFGGDFYVFLHVGFKLETDVLETRFLDTIRFWNHSFFQTWIQKRGQRRGGAAEEVLEGHPGAVEARAA